MHSGIFRTIEQWIFGSPCCLCGLEAAPFEDFCKVCITLLPPLTDRCFRCALPLVPGFDSIYCERCRIEPPPFDRTCGLFEYKPPINHMIGRLKFSGNFVYGRVLGAMLAKQIPRWYAHLNKPQAIIPMPLHRHRFLKRGFNQALELSLATNKILKLPCLIGSCERIKDTPSQSTLNKETRKRNLNAAFQVRRPGQFKSMESVAIVDDVVTTGSTVSALATCLKEAGVMQVDVWCIARA